MNFSDMHRDLKSPSIAPAKRRRELMDAHDRAQDEGTKMVRTAIQRLQAADDQYRASKEATYRWPDPGDRPDTDPTWLAIAGAVVVGSVAAVVLPATVAIVLSAVVAGLTRVGQAASGRPAPEHRPSLLATIGPVVGVAGAAAAGTWSLCEVSVGTGEGIQRWLLTAMALLVVLVVSLPSAVRRAKWERARARHLSAGQALEAAEATVANAKADLEEAEQRRSRLMSAHPRPRARPPFGASGNLHLVNSPSRP